MNIARLLARSALTLGLGAATLLSAAAGAQAQDQLAPPKLGAPIGSTQVIMPAIADGAVPTQIKELPASPKEEAKSAPATEAGAQDAPAKSAWLDSPKTATIAKPGFFPVPPSGCGYYSLLDLITGEKRDNRPKFGYPAHAIMANSFFDTDWRYVDQPGANPDFLEKLHRIHLGDNWLFATGGEARWRSFHEDHSRLTAGNNNFDLTRLRVFGDLWYKDTFRVYVEFISAQSFNQDLAPLIVDRNYFDILNLFVDIKVFEDANCVPYYVRAGRQELLLGSQRLISPLDWANTRRTFDGVRAFRHGEKLDVDVFWTRLVNPDVQRWDVNDPQQNFIGAFVEYRPTKTQAIDLYWLFLDNDNIFNFAKKTPVTFGQLPTAPYDVHTLGFRFAGSLEKNKNVLFDFENMLQLGHSDFTGGSIVAGASTTGLGYNFSHAPMNPTVWAYFDYASGSKNPQSGQMSTFNQIYPFNHYYFGWLDYVGRSNINDLNAHLYLYPTKWVTLDTQFHCFMLDRATDALYNAGSTIVRFDPTGKAGRDVGREFDLIANFHLTPRQDILAAYGHMWFGRFLRSTGAGGTYADTFWLMYNVRW